jgi:GH24 family phage-related lysozyme (muramidase)
MVRRSFEGFYPRRYLDVAGIPTIGYGTLCRDNGAFASP